MGETAQRITDGSSDVTRFKRFVVTVGAVSECDRRAQDETIDYRPGLRQSPETSHDHSRLLAKL